jgi:hypothetical protein
VDQIEEWTDLAVAVEEMSISEFFPQWVVSVEVAKPDHVVVVSSRCDFGMK